MHEGRIVIENCLITVDGLQIHDADVAEYLTRLGPQERTGAFTKALQIGVFCLNRADGTRDIDFVRRQIEALMGEVTRSLEKLPFLTQEALLQKIGTGNGQVLAPVQNLIDQAAASTTARLKEVKDLLAQDIDPGKDSSTLGRALRVLRELLDPKRSDSIQASVQTALGHIASDSGPLANSLRETLATALLPIQHELAELAKEVRGKEAVAEVIASTPLKGVTFEHEILAELQQWARSTGAEVHHVGTDNRSGDIVLRIVESGPMSPVLSVVVEVRDRQAPAGRKSITDTLNRAMEARGANAAIYISRHADGLALEVGDWAEGECEKGRWIACTRCHVLTAIRFLIVQEHIARLRQASSEFDAHSIASQVQRVRISIERVKKITRRVGEVRGSADEIQQEAEILRDEIRGALVAMEDSLHSDANLVGDNGISHLEKDNSEISSRN